MLILSGCAPAGQPPGLPTTLNMRTVNGTSVAFQSGIPVPTFAAQPRLTLDLDGQWRADRIAMDSDLSLTRRSVSLSRIVAEAGNRQQPEYDDSHWDLTQVPGSLDIPPQGPAGGAWLRRSFDVPIEWSNATVTLKFGAVNYVVDAWLNGRYLGYHEGGSTPFAFDVSDLIQPGAANVLALRIDDPPWGTRQDIVPWGLTDWWNYMGVVQPVWLEATGSLYAARADVVPHLDRADVVVVLQHRGQGTVDAQAQVEILPAAVTDQNLTVPGARSLVPDGELPIASTRVAAGQLGADSTAVVHASFALQDAQLWSPQSPALYVLHVTVLADGQRADQLYETFGLRRLVVDAGAPRLLLNGDPVSFAGVAVHDERVFPSSKGRPRGGPITDAGNVLLDLEHAREVHAQLIRADHTPANPLLLMLADRLGFAIWEEIPLYHYTPVTFGIAMGRGLPQQMLREMDLRDFNHPSVLFHGLANESTGGADQERALAELHRIDRALDGTRLTGQAYAANLGLHDSTSNPLDVAGFTLYYGVLYGGDPAADTAAALAAAHRQYPRKPIMVMEFGRWADSPGEEPVQRKVFTDTYSPIARVLDTEPGGYVGSAVWWSLDDYWSMKPGIMVEHFGLFASDQRPRQAADAAASLFTPGAGLGDQRHIVSGARAAPVTPPSAAKDIRFVFYVGYAIAISVVLLGAMMLILQRHRVRWRWRRA